MAYLLMPVKLAKHRLRRDGRNQLHVGCGSIYLPGWINADLHPRAEFILDLRRRLPFRSDSLRRIYSEHVVEHLTVEEGLRFFTEAHRVLRPGGVLRIGMPDLDHLVDGYNSGEWREFDWISWPGHEFIQTGAEMLNVAFRWWGHQHLYNREELDRRLRDAGFANIEFPLPGDSRHAELRGLEQRPDTQLVAEATK